jgi:hypothetical protein
MPTQVELEKELADLQQKYEQELDAIFTNLYKRVDQIELAPDQIELAPEQPQIEPPSQSQKSELPQSQSLSSSPYTKPPRWRDTWRYQGLKGLLKRAWKGTNPEDDIAWKYSSESIQSRLTLQEYLALNETIDSCLDYYFVIEETSHPEIQKAFEDAKQQIKTLLQRYLLHAHRLGIKLGDLTATDRHMHIPKQQNLFPDIEDTPSGNTASKNNTTCFPIKSQKKYQQEIFLQMRQMQNERSHYHQRNQRKHLPYQNRPSPKRNQPWH